MDFSKIIEEVEENNIYNHILKLEGVKHFITNPEFLEESADYIKSELQSYNVKVGEQKLNFDGVGYSFRNIEGVIGEEGMPELLISSHYDTVDNTPGANDNTSAVAVMLEVARILSKLEIKNYCIRFVSFTLEELHPVYYLKQQKWLKDFKLVDERNRYCLLSTHKIMKLFDDKFRKLSSKGKSYSESANKAYDAIKNETNENENQYFKMVVRELGKIDNPYDQIGRSGLVGSTKWVEKAVNEKRDVCGVLNLETIGYTSKLKNSQRLPSPIFKLFPSYKVKDGNYISFIGDKNSGFLCKSFAKACRQRGINLPYVKISLPVSFETIAKKARDLLRSDHAPFWREGIPGIMITDTANFRYPFYHTQADTIDKLDFDFLTKICKATIISSLDLTRQKFE